MTDFSTLVHRFASAAKLDAAELRALLAVATNSEADAGLAETVGCIGGTEATVARIIAAACAERAHLEAELRLIIAGERRPSDVSAFLWRVANERGRPPADIAGALGVLADWSLVADAIERRLTPQRPAQRGGELHEVHA